MISSLEKHLEECSRKHGHICPGQVLGVRMALLGCNLVDVVDPLIKDRKNILVWVEIDRCLTDAIAVVTGTSLGRRSMKFFDYGKAAATFYNVINGFAKRISAFEESRDLAKAAHPFLDKKDAQMLFYKEASNEELFKVEDVLPLLKESDMPGSPKRRVFCEVCKEGVNDGREVYTAGGGVFCRWCLQGGYYHKLPDNL